MNDTARGVGWFGLTLAGLFVLGLFLLGWYEFFGPRYRAVDSRIYYESQQYTDAKKQRLETSFQMRYRRLGDGAAGQ